VLKIVLLINIFVETDTFLLELFDEIGRSKEHLLFFFNTILIKVEIMWTDDIPEVYPSS